MSARYLVVGGSSGIGLELVKTLSASGNEVLVFSRTWEHGLLDRVQHQTFNVVDDDPSQLSLPDSLNGMAYCPGSINLKSIRALTLETVRADFELNVIGAVKVVQAVIKSLKSGANQSGTTSSILFYSTVAVGQGIPMHASVAASKGAIEGLTRSIAADLSPQIRANCIAPALTKTPLAQAFFSSEEKAAKLAQMYPLGRTGVASDIAEMSAFLLGPKSSWLTGQVIGIDGGMSSIKK
ncbi:MAG: SDR family oxidoreductase [Planctomycetota bacterium]